MVLLYESAASLSTLSSSSAHKSPTLTIHYLPGSMLLFLLCFFLFSPFLYLYKNKAFLMTMGSQGPAGARVLKCVCGGKGGTSSFSSSSFITGENRGSRGVNVLLLRRGLGYLHGSGHVECISFLLKETVVGDLFFRPLGSTSFSNCRLKRFSFHTFT